MRTVERVSPRRLADQSEVARGHSTVHRVLYRAGVSRRPRPEQPTVVRYQWPCPGQLRHMDVKRFGKFTAPGHALTGDRTQRSRRVGWEYCHSIIDDCSRLAYSELHDDETAPTVTAFTRRALDFFLDHGIVAERLMTDNAFAYIHSQACANCSTAARSATSARAPTRPGPTAKSSATSRRCNANGPTPWNTPQATPVGPHCHTGYATTTSGAPTARSATALPSNTFGTSPGSTARTGTAADRRDSAAASGRPRSGLLSSAGRRVRATRRRGRHALSDRKRDRACGPLHRLRRPRCRRRP